MILFTRASVWVPADVDFVAHFPLNGRFFNEIMVNVYQELFCVVALLLFEKHLPLEVTHNFITILNSSFIKAGIQF